MRKYLITIKLIQIKLFRFLLIKYDICKRNINTFESLVALSEFAWFSFILAVNGSLLIIAA